MLFLLGILLQLYWYNAQGTSVRENEYSADCPIRGRNRLAGAKWIVSSPFHLQFVQAGGRNAKMVGHSRGPYPLPTSYLNDETRRIPEMGFRWESFENRNDLDPEDIPSRILRWVSGMPKAQYRTK